MASFSIPDEKGRILQLNSGASLGNVFASYGVDFESNKGKIRVSSQVKKLLTNADDADFNGYAAAIVPYSTDGTNGKLFAVSDKAFSTDFTNPIGTWTKETVGNEPNVGNTVTDAVVFDGLTLVADATNINAWNGSTWTNNYWTSTLGQAALTSGQRHLMKVGSDGNLYIVDRGNKLYRVHPVDGATVTGQGTLDLSATNYRFQSMAATSTRLFIGAQDLGGGDGVILEWDMSPDSVAPNKIHKVGAQGVPCIAVWNDVAIAVLTSGKVKYFDNLKFVDYDNVEFPVPANFRLSDNFIHPNGWTIIDDLPHFLAMGRSATQNVPNSVKETDWAFPAAVWCLDPSIGLYPRFPIGTGESTQSDYGKPAMKEVGALFAYKAGRQDETKFLCSYEYYLANGTDVRSVLAYFDNANTQASRAWLATPFSMSFREAWKNLETFHKPMPTGCSIRVYTRTEDEDPVRFDGAYASTTQINTASIGYDIEKGDLAYIKMGPGSGQWIRIDAVEQSSGTTSITFESANTFAVAGNSAVLEIFKFRYMGTITSSDYTQMNVADTGIKRKRQFLFEFIQAANKEIEVDAILVTT